MEKIEIFSSQAFQEESMGRYYQHITWLFSAASV